MRRPFDHPFLGRGFRPFFLLGALYAAFSMGLWALQMQGGILPERVIADPVLWHGHEMLFGFTMAIVAGFLLTAVANWTGGAPARQIHLAGLCVLWLAGRLAMNLPSAYHGAAVVVDMAFIPALAVSLAVPLLRSWNKRNFAFLLLLTALFLCNAAMFLWQDRRALYLAVLLIMAMISLIGSRIIPAFTVAALRRRGIAARIYDQPRLDVAALASVALLAAAIPLFGAVHPVTAGIALISAGLHGWRMRRYHMRRVWRDPLLWSLHLGHAWLVGGLALFGIGAMGWSPLSPALHALTAGAIGTMTLSMMCRVALGHTGRELRAGGGTVALFLLIQLSAVLRVAIPSVMPGLYHAGMMASAVFWMAAYLLYAVLYAPVLWRPRPDGGPA